MLVLIRAACIGGLVLERLTFVAIFCRVAENFASQTVFTLDAPFGSHLGMTANVFLLLEQKMLLVDHYDYMAMLAKYILVSASVAWL